MASLQIKGNEVFAGRRPLLMGVVNATPDSFSDGSADATLEDRVALARELLDAGAQIIDIGGESGITGVPPVEAEEEKARVLPVIEAVSALIAGGGYEAVISVDTYKPEVATAAIAAGAQIVNDVSGLQSLEIVEVCAHTGAGLVIMHTRALPKQRLQDDDLYEDVVEDVYRFLSDRLAAAVGQGMREEQIVLDPGPDFSKTPAQTVAVLKRLDRLQALGRPLLLAISRKDFIGAITLRAPRDRLAGTLAALAYALTKGGEIFRLHDIAAARDFIAVHDALTGNSDIPRDLRLPEKLRWQTQ